MPDSTHILPLVHELLGISRVQMIPTLIVAVNWQTEVSKSLLEQALARYRNSSHYSCIIEYESTRSPAGKREATRDSVSLSFRREGDSYTVTPLDTSLGTYRASGGLAKVDPYLVFDHHLTLWLGFRTFPLTHRLLPPSFKGPRYSFFDLGPTKIAVYETYLGESAPFQITYTIDKERTLIDSIALCGPIAPVRGKNRPPVFYSETVVFKNQQVQP